MKKQFLLNLTLLLCALVAGNASGWGQSDYSAVYTSNITLPTTSGTYASGCTVIINTINYTGTKLGASGSGGSTTITAPAGTKYIHLHVAGWNKKSPTFTYKIGSGDAQAISGITSNSGIANSSPFTFNGDPSSSDYYKIITLGTALASNTTITLTSASERVVFWGVNVEALPTGVTIKNGSTPISELNMTEGDEDVALTATVAPEKAFQGIVWDTTDADVATVTNGVIHAVGAGSTTITATSTADNTKYAECTVNVSSASSPSVAVSTIELDFDEVAVGQSKQLTFTVTPANLASDLTIASNNSKYTVSPTSIPQATTTAQTITVTAAPTDITDNMDGTITISGGGILTKSVSLLASLYQIANVTLIATDSKGTFKQGETVITSITSRVGNTATITAVPVNGYLFDSWTAIGATPSSSNTATTEFTFTSTTPTLIANFVVDPRLFATLDGTDMTSMGANAYGTVKTLQKDGLTWQTTGYKDNTNTAMIQLKSSSSPYIKLPEFSGNIYDITFSVTNASASAKDGTKTDGTLHFKTSTDGASIASGGGSSTNEIIIDLSNVATKYNTGYITLSGNGARIWNITVSYIPTDINVSVSSANYATFSDHLARDFSGSGITVYAATATASSVELDEVTDGIVPANTGVVLYSATAVNDVEIPVATTDASYDFSANEMIGVNTLTTVALAGESGKTNYILANGGSGVGFYKAKTEGANLAAHKAYLSTATAAAARGFLGFEEETTGIESIANSMQSGDTYYNLAGQRVAMPTKGLFIVNGKKVVK